ncbi:hypothetical protein AB1L30_03080 [Bremerella sp. JC817]|uniref:SGNH/GDSL hydrolase family protein n=1 Tax=Bremerella sp. JC817 TaxID=3231756 RepID=UPI00345997B0
MTQKTTSDRISEIATNGNGRYASRPLLLILFQLLLIVLVVREFEIEKGRGLAELLYLVLGGFVLYAILPLSMRLPGFLLLSLVACIQVVGWIGTAWIWGLGGVLIGISHLPIPFFLRALLLVGGGATLAWYRSTEDQLFWAILGSMFMFRLLVYVRQRNRTSAPLSMQLSYFFMLPNASFPFYPIVDYQTFCDSWFNRPGIEIAQRGINWIARGLMHLLLYRGIKYFLLPSPEDVRTVSDVGLFLVTNYMLYLRISGSFHIITGILHLFGFNLPRTHENYFLASSFIDIWRRINIYWKVFLERQFFYPAFFHLRRFGDRAAIVGAIAFVFVVTWALHSYQVFWLVGEFPISINEAGLWLIAGIVVAVNGLLDYNRAARPVAKPMTAPLLHSLRHCLQVMGVFLTVATFWACWTVPGFFQWIGLLASTNTDFWQGLGSVCLIVVATIVSGTFLHWQCGGKLAMQDKTAAFATTAWRAPAVVSAAMAALLLMGMPWFADQFDLRTREKIVNMQREMLTAAEVSRDVQGYYEQLANVNFQSDPLVRGGNPRPAGEAVIFEEITRPRDDLLEMEMIPGWRGTLVDKPIEINSHGMRNPPVSHRKAPNTYRVAVVGSSVTMGYGVEEQETFVRLLEQKINAAMPKDGPQVELLNFGIGRYYALHTAAALRAKVFDFQPDAIWYVAHQGEFQGPPRHIAQFQQKGHALLYPCIDEILDEAGITSQTSQGAVEVLLQARAEAITECIYTGINQDCREREILPVWIYLPIPEILEETASDDAIVGVAKRSGMVTLDLRKWSEGIDSTTLKIGSADHHLNAMGHSVAAEAIWRAIQSKPSALPVLPSERP